MTNELLDEWERMFKACTPGRWGVEQTGHDLWIGPMRKHGSKISEIIYHRDLYDYKPEYIEQAEADAEWTAFIHNAFPMILDALRKQLNQPKE